MNEKNTLGRRIQEGRKAACLSQEALGERLNVSRQAVSKWEADAAIPELENLIAMSRIFGVSIGQLLGVEPEEPDGAEKELAAVEAIAAKYAAGQKQQPLWSRNRRLIAAALAAVLVLAVVFLLKRQMDSIDRRFLQLQQQVNGIESSVSGQIGSLAVQISDILEEKNNILSDSQAVVTDFDPGAQTVTLCVSASPKEWTDTTSASFTATLSDGRQFTAEAAGQNGTFTAEGFVVPMDPTIQLSVALVDGSSARTGALETLHDCLPGNYRLDVLADWTAARCDSGGSVLLSGLRLHIDAPPNLAALSPAAVDLCLYRNQETEPEQVIPIEEAVPLFQEVGFVQMYQADYQASFTLNKDDTMVAAVRITDNYGQTAWTVMDAYRIRSGNTAESLEFSGMDSWVPGAAIP